MLWTKLEEAEHYLDRIEDEACDEARLFASDAAGLIALVEHVRKLSRS